MLRPDVDHSGGETLWAVDVKSGTVVSSAYFTVQDVDQAILRLPASSFSELPQNIVKWLEDREYTIPQAYPYKEPHNVIHGEFTTKGQEDWAVLSSRQGESFITIFWGGSTQATSQIDTMEDKRLLAGSHVDIRGYGRIPSYARHILVLSRTKSLDFSNMMILI